MFEKEFFTKFEESVWQASQIDIGLFDKFDVKTRIKK